MFVHWVYTCTQIDLLGISIHFSGYTLVKEKTKCDDGLFVKGTTKQSKGYKESVGKCYEACKDQTGMDMFIYHIVGRSDADCNDRGCFCACYDTKMVECEIVSSERMNLYTMLP